MTRSLLDVQDLEVTFGQQPAVVRAVDGVSLSVQRGEVVGLVGESGSGKSTIGRAVLGLTGADSGSIYFDDQDVTTASGRARRRLATEMQVVFQDPLSSLDPRWTIGRSLAEPLRLHTRLRGQGLDAEVAKLLTSVGLPGGTARRIPRQLSGGQRQRVAIARALALSPRLIVCDEPTSALDLSTQSQILNLLRGMQRERGLSYLFISHDLDVIRYISDRIVVLYRGRVMESGGAQAVADNAQHPYSRALIGSSPIPDPRAQAARRAARNQGGGQTTAATGAIPAQSCPFADRCQFVAEVCRNQRPALVTLADNRALACHMFDPGANHPSPQVTTLSGQR